MSTYGTKKIVVDLLKKYDFGKSGYLYMEEFVSRVVQLVFSGARRFIAFFL
jgi:Ca2+-binding EF-hand superfamily protein